MSDRRRKAFGPEVLGPAGVVFRLWAPAAGAVVLQLEQPSVEHGPGPRGRFSTQPEEQIESVGASPELIETRGALVREVPLAASGEGWFEALVPEARPGAYYRFAIDGRPSVPDPASRYQPHGVHGASEVIDPAAHIWQDGAWRGRPFAEAVFYELHVGSFSPEGTYKGVERRLDHLVDLGITAIELMPVAAFPGRRDWGYNGVYPYASAASYGRPEDLKALVDAAHRRGLMMFLDLVCNHFGPDGNFLPSYAPEFFDPARQTPWGAAINFDGPHSRPVRDFFLQCAQCWLEDYHFDGLRLDAVHAIFDDSDPDIVSELATDMRRRFAGRHLHLVLENDDNQASYLRPQVAGGPASADAQWNDDWHHVMHVLLTGETSGYYTDYVEAPLAKLRRALTEGFIYQGETSPYRGGAQRGSSSGDLPPIAFVAFLQNHDQIGNRAMGDRLTQLAPPPAMVAATALLLLQPSPPLLFMGEEWASAKPFPFFCDLPDELHQSVRDGRGREFARAEDFSGDLDALPDPLSIATFTSARLDWNDLEQEPHRGVLATCRRLLEIRRREIVPRLRGGDVGRAIAAFADSAVVAVEWRLGDGAMLRLIGNFTADPTAEAIALPAGQLLYCSHDAVREGDAPRVLPGWFVAWFLATVGAPGA